jgi:hypothetical protein
MGRYEPSLPADASRLEQRIEFFLCSCRRRGQFAGEEDGDWGEIIAIIGCFFVADSTGFGFSALIVLGGIVVLAVAANVKIGVAGRASVTGENSSACRQDDPFAAFPAAQFHPH